MSFTAEQRQQLADAPDWMLYLLGAITPAWIDVEGTYLRIERKAEFYGYAHQRKAVARLRQIARGERVLR